VAGPIRKQLIPVIGTATTGVCLDAAGQVRDVGEPYDTAAGQFDFPPFHVGCRSLSAPWLPGFPGHAAAEARAELADRAATETPPPTPAGAAVLAAAGVAAVRSAARAASNRRQRATRRRVS